jgi:hypothetical protein
MLKEYPESKVFTAQEGSKFIRAVFKKIGKPVA